MSATGVLLGGHVSVEVLVPVVDFLVMMGRFGSVLYRLIIDLDTLLFCCVDSGLNEFLPRRLKIKQDRIFELGFLAANLNTS